MSCNTTFYTRDTCSTRWHLVAIFGAVERMFVIAFAGTPKVATRCHFVLQIDSTNNAGIKEICTNEPMQAVSLSN
eukprot:999292-Pleurochrysis_carterae.AAC.1